MVPVYNCLLYSLGIFIEQNVKVIPSSHHTRDVIPLGTDFIWLIMNAMIVNIGRAVHISTRFFFFSNLDNGKINLFFVCFTSTVCKRWILGLLLHTFVHVSIQLFVLDIYQFLIGRHSNRYQFQ